MSIQSISSVFCSKPAARLPRKTGGSDQDQMRYSLVVAKQPGQEIALRIFDRARSCFFLGWSGAIVRYLLDSGALPAELIRAGYCDCDKSTIWHLILAGAVIQRTLDQMGHPESELNSVVEQPLTWPAHRQSVSRGSLSESLRGRMLRLGVQLSGPHKLLARMLFARPGQHFSAEDVACLLLLECPSLVFAEGRLSAYLDELARWYVIQRIEVDCNNIFYDINTRPHLHVYNSRTRELHDANLQGILHVDADSSHSHIELVGKSNIATAT